jgi:hypothetical protein
MWFDMGFQLISIMVPAVFVIVLAVFILIFVKGIGTWSKNNRSPRLTVDAVVTAKRAEVSHHHTAGGGAGACGGGVSSSTWYYVTFQVESGDRMELSVSGQDYGMMAEGDRGSLSFQGTRFLGFQRR